MIFNWRSEVVKAELYFIIAFLYTRHYIWYITVFLHSISSNAACATQAANEIISTPLRASVFIPMTVTTATMDTPALSALGELAPNDQWGCAVCEGMCMERSGKGVVRQSTWSGWETPRVCLAFVATGWFARNRDKKASACLSKLP
jgi:hypothetical protein